MKIIFPYNHIFFFTCTMRNILRQYVTFTLKKEGIIIKEFLLHLVRSVLVSDLKMHTGQNRDIQLKIVLT